MPYQSAKQRAYLHVHEPKLAARWDREYGGRVKRQRSRTAKNPTGRRRIAR